MLTHNLHAHTFRCNHATGTEREYIENAIRGGMRVYGFSDHSPYVFEGDYYSGFRMKPDMLDGYVKTISALRDEYKNDIEIHIGLEAEYYPRFFDAFLRLIEPYPIEYLILGQHFLNNEMGQTGATAGTDDIKLLEAFVRQTQAAIETGVFSYVAHPDVFRFTGDIDVYKKNVRGICETALIKNVPLEINLLGIRTGRAYPRREFWEIAGEVGNEVVFGVDAHAAEDAVDFASYDVAMGMVQEFGLKFRDMPRLISPAGGRE